MAIAWSRISSKVIACPPAYLARRALVAATQLLSQLHRRARLGPRCRLLTGSGRLQHQAVRMPAPDDLQGHGQPLAGKTTRHTGGWLAGLVKGKGEMQAVEHRRRGFALDTTRPTLD